MSDHLESLRAALDAGTLTDDALVPAGRLALAQGDLTLAARLLDAARRAGVVGGTAGLEAELKLVLGGPPEPAAAAAASEPQPAVARAVGAADHVTFADVGGLDEVKKTIHRTIVLPYQRPDLYERYGRRAGGGVLLYGPPGCGKTLLARATAGECGVPFFNLRIEDVLDPYFGGSEQRLHQAFDDARAAAPCVLFLDEIDALAYARRKQQGGMGRSLVDQLLQELDAIGSDNRGILVLAATNAPWVVDDALKRPGRFDRVVFVAPPDAPARRHILELRLADRPVAHTDAGAIAGRADLHSGADLAALVERATDAAIDEALASGGDVPISQAHLERALADARPTTLEWLRTARNYVEFANQGGRYDDVLDFLGRREVKAAVKGR